LNNNKNHKTIRLSKAKLRAIAQMDMAAAFACVYNEKLWGDDAVSAFYSGSGSHDIKQVKPYVHQVRQFLQSLPEPADVVDLGCGDFNIGKQLVAACSHYHGCDIVEGLIDYNNQHYAQAHVQFSCLDATQDLLPAGNVLLVRQVLQHLSNEAILAICSQFQRFDFVIVTEHLPQGTYNPNIDKPTGPDSRLRFSSGVDITAPPFAVACKDETVICEVQDTDDSTGIIKTILYQMPT